MTESRIKKLWKNIISQQITGLNLCISPSGISLQKQDNTKVPSPINASQRLNIISHTSNTNKQNKLWRKPLPSDCPVFDFVRLHDEKKTVVDTAKENISSPLDEKTEIPTRYASRYYETKIPNLEAHLDRASKNAKAILLTKLLSAQQQKQRH